MEYKNEVSEKDFIDILNYTINNISDFNGARRVDVYNVLATFINHEEKTLEDENLMLMFKGMCLDLLSK